MLKHKFNAVRTERDGLSFASKAEARYYERLKARQAAGEVVGFLRQVPFHLPGGVRYVVDFMEFHTDGSVHFIDVKGMVTKEFKTKMRLLKALYPWALVETVKA
jgi:hypothetical protein